VIQQKKIFSFFLVLVLFTLSRCANPVSPTGGPKDTKPPESVKCTPPNFTINFVADEIKIEFDEFIQLKDANNQITISPPWLPNADFKIRGKSIIVKLNDSLHANTTYAFNFGDAISDITESNVLRNFMYVFSTGPYIDSLSLDGQVIDAFNLAPQKDVLVMLYLDNNDTIPFDSLPYKVKPYHLTRTNENGEFNLTNLSEDSFKIFALKDINSSLTYDLPDEKIAFVDSLVKGNYKVPVSTDTLKKDTITPDTAILRTESKSLNVLRMFQQYDSVQRIKRFALIQDGQVGLYFRYPLKRPEFIPLNFTPYTGWSVEEINRSQDTVNLWLNNLPGDSLVLQVLDEGKIIDTVILDLKQKAEKPKIGKKEGPVTKRLLIKSNITGGYLKQFTNDLILTFSYPLSRYNFSSVSLAAGEDTLKPKIVFTDSLKRSISIINKWKEDKKYMLIIPDSSFYGINNLTNDSLIIPLKTRSERDFGTLKINITLKESGARYIIQLLDEKEGILDERRLTGSGMVEFKYLDVRKYKIKAINDQNRNGRWDTGVYLEKLQPEETIFFPKTIEIRANWDVEESWDL
jgi:hypothetical protein